MREDLIEMREKMKELEKKSNELEDEKDKGRKDLGIKECGKREDKWEKRIQDIKRNIQQNRKKEKKKRRM